MPNRKKWIRYVLYAVEILLLFLLQDTPGLLPQIMGVKPLPVLSAAHHCHGGGVHTRYGVRHVRRVSCRYR